MTAPDNTLTTALQYAALGLRVIPIAPGTKIPAGINAWQHAATTDPDTITTWYTGPHAGWGIGLAPAQLPDGRWWFAVDIDGASHGADGETTWHHLCADQGVPPDTVEATTGGGGRHLLYAAPYEIRNIGFAPGIDIRGHGGQINVEPTTHPNGQPYTWVDGQAPWEHPITDAPTWLLQMVTPVAPEPRPAPPSTPPAATGDRPGDIWAATTTWAQILEADGWTHHHTDRAGEAHWTRPGKHRRDGTSATTNYGNTDTLKVFTSSMTHMGLQPEATYTKIGYLAATRHNGDHAAAARALRDQGHHAPPGLNIHQLAGTGASSTPVNGASAAAPAAGPDGWPTLRPLDEPAPRTPFPTHLLPTWIRDQVHNVATQLGCDPMLPAMFGLGALSVASMGHINIAMRAKEIAKNTGLYLIAAGDPGAGKTPALEFMFAPIEHHEQALMAAAEKEVAKAEMLRGIAEKAAKTAKDNAANPGADDNHQQAAIDAAARLLAITIPPHGRLMTSDITPERLGTLMAENAERMAVVSDESGVLTIDRYGDKARGTNMDLYLGGFTGRATTIDRQTAPSIRLREPLLAIVAGVQPGVLRAAMADPEWRTRGLGQRFLTTATDQLATNIDLDQDTWNHDIGDTYDQNLTKLARQWSSWATPALVTLSPEARRTYGTWAGQLLEREQLGGDLEGEAGWVTKMRSSVVRIAALFHLADGNKHSDPVDAPTMARAAELGHYFIDQHLYEISTDHTTAKRLLATLTRLANTTPDRTVTKRMIGRQAAKDLRTPERYEAPMAVLIERGLVRLAGDIGGPGTTIRDGIRACTGFQIRPTSTDNDRQISQNSDLDHGESKSVGHVGMSVYRPFLRSYPQKSVDIVAYPQPDGLHPQNPADITDNPPRHHSPSPTAATPTTNTQADPDDWFLQPAPVDPEGTHA